MPFMFFEPTMLLLIPALIFTLWAQWKVKHAYNKYSKIGVRAGLTGAQVADIIMRAEGVSRDVPIEAIPGQMTDHYDPTKKVVRLSHDVYSGRSIAALGIAAHEVGHAIQDDRKYVWMGMRSFVYPVAQIGSGLAIPIFFVGLLLGMFAQAPFGFLLMNIGIWLFAGAVAFTIITLPVEFDASRRAVRALAGGGQLTDDEMRGVKAVLTAAAMTYVAAAAMAVSQLIRFIILAQMARD